MTVMLPLFCLLFVGVAAVATPEGLPEYLALVEFLKGHPDRRTQIEQVLGTESHKLDEALVNIGANRDNLGSVTEHLLFVKGLATHERLLFAMEYDQTQQTKFEAEAEAMMASMTTTPKPTTAPDSGDAGTNNGDSGSGSGSGSGGGSGGTCQCDGMRHAANIFMLAGAGFLLLLK